MSNYIPLTFDQCREALVRLQQYAIWMYQTPDGITAFSKNEMSDEGRKFSLSIESDGRIAAILKDTGSKVIYDTMTTTVPTQENSLDNIDYRIRIANPEDLPAGDVEFGRRIGVFALSLFQRTQAFQFFSVMQSGTIDRIATDLSLAVQPSTT